VKGIYHSSTFLESTSDVPSGAPVGVLLDRTNFYAESGGQEYDTGVITIDGKAEFKVEDVQIYNGYVLHIGQMEDGEIKVGDEVVCTYDEVSFPSLLCSLLTTPSFDVGRSATIIPVLTS